MSMMAVENISIADARRIINSSIPSSSSLGSPDDHSPDYNNFPYLPRRKSPREGHSFESHIRFGLSDEEVTGPRYSLMPV